MSGQIINSYATLEQAVQDWLARSDLTDTNFLPEILQMGQDRIFKGFTDNRGNYYPGLRIRQMESQFASGGILTVTLGGTLTGYSGTVLGLTFDAAPAGGVTATGYGVITSGTLTSVVITNPGMGYVSVPNVTVSSGSATVTVTISQQPTISPSGNFAVPADYLELEYMDVITSTGPFRLERKPAEWIYRYYGPTGNIGVPNYVGRDGPVFIFAPNASSSYVLSGYYYAQPAYLSTTNTTNFLTSAYPSMLLAACLTEACGFIQDMDKLPYWENRLVMLVNSARMGDRDEKFSGSPLSMAPG